MTERELALAVVLVVTGVSEAALAKTKLVETLYQSAAAAGSGREGTQALATVYERLGSFSYSD